MTRHIRAAACLCTAILLGFVGRAPAVQRVTDMTDVRTTSGSTRDKDRAPPSEAYDAPVEEPLTPQLGLTEEFAAFTGATAVQSFSGSYIDSPIVGGQLRFRFDNASGNPLPDRAEFFYAKCGCFNEPDARGPILPETNVDYQEFMGYLEMAIVPRFSMFIEVPFRAINPENNDNATGVSDLNTGFKYALMQCCHEALTLQFRIYTPTGEADRGLGNGHVSLEPAVLYFNQLTDRWSIFGEFRDWIPLSDAENPRNGQDFDGNILRYGVGTGYDLWQSTWSCEPRRLTAIGEMVGWTILNGYASNPAAPPPLDIPDVSGDTIVNAKIGLRYTAGERSLAVSYGHAITGDEWYEDILRVEYRVAF